MEMQVRQEREETSTSSSNSTSDDDEGIPQLQAVAAAVTTPDITVENSTDVQVGPRYNYTAPLTINQFVQVASTTTGTVPPELLLQTALESTSHQPGCHGVTQSPRSVSPEPVASKQHKPPEKCGVLQILWSLFVICLLISVCLGATVGVQWKNRLPFSEHSLQFPTDSSFLTEESTTAEVKLLGGHKFYSRHEWGALNDIPAEPLIHPSPIAVISHTKQHLCNSFESCKPALQNMNISWNFLVSSDGSVYEGRGWDKQSELQLPEVALSVSLIGDYNKVKLQPVQEDAVLQLLAAGVKMGKLHPKYKIVSQAQIDGTSAGKNTVTTISKWPHYDSNFRVPI